MRSSGKETQPASQIQRGRKHTISYRPKVEEFSMKIGVCPYFFYFFVLFLQSEGAFIFHLTLLAQGVTTKGTA
jgi:hypothetical protein